MPKDECRESRVVPFSAQGIAWAAAAAGAVRQSVGVDVDATGRLLSTPRLLPYQRQVLPFAAPPPAHEVLPFTRRPLTQLDGNAEVVRQALSAEIRALEKRLRRADLQVKAQDRLIRDFCKLELTRENENNNR